MGKIAVLSGLVQARIAAGEVIERPASAVKELVENSLDAGATRIEIELEQGGRRRIRVCDDGEGMDAGDLALSVERFATSKLRSEDDLARVATLGFRGEALPSLAAVAELEIVTRQRSAGNALRLRMEPGGRPVMEPAAGPPGTSVEARALFARVPARLKFLRSDATETSAVCEVVERLALARPDVAFRLRADGKELLSAPQGQTLRERVAAVLGEEVARGLLELRAGERGWLAVEGLVQSPDAPARRDRRWGFLTLNRRPIKDRVLSHAVESAYVSALPAGQFPTYVLHVGIDPSQVDVNVHPSKLEVRFRSSGSVHDFVSASVREALRRPAGAEARTLAPGPGGGGRASRAAERRSTEQFDLWRGGALAGESPAPFGEGPAPGARVIGSLREGYVLVETERDLRIVDPHALHERALYERLSRAASEGATRSQTLLVPETVELSPAEAATFERAKSALEELGFVAEAFGGRTAIVRAVPEGVPSAASAEILREVLSDLDSGGEGRSSELLERVRRSLACRAAVKLGTRLDPAELAALVEQSGGTPPTCPHGRPIAWVLTHEEIARRLGR